MSERGIYRMRFEEESAEIGFEVSAYGDRLGYHRTPETHISDLEHAKACGTNIFGSIDECIQAGRSTPIPLKVLNKVCELGLSAAASHVWGLSFRACKSAEGVEDWRVWIISRGVEAHLQREV